MQDVIIIGGGAAGLSTALYLGRSRRSVSVIDAGHPRNAPAAAVHGLLTRDGIAPLEMIRLARADLAPYDVSLVDGTVVSAVKIDNGFQVTLEDGTIHTATRIVVTTGVIDQLPEIPGLAERWGKDLAHCPYCHGWEIRDQAIGVIGNGTFAAHQALLFRQWSPNITLFLNNALMPTAAELQQLAARGIRLVEGPVSRIHSEDDAVTSVELADGTIHPVQALTTQSWLVARAAFLSTLGLVPVTSDFGELLECDANGASTVPGVWVAGNVTNMSATVPASAVAGAWVAMMTNMDMMAEEVADAVATHEAAVHV